MACELTTGFSIDCNDAIGGIKTIYLQKLSDFATGVTLDGTSGEVDALPEATVYPYDSFYGLASNFEETISNEAAGSISYTATINLQLKKVSQVKQRQLALLAKSRVVAFVLDNAGNIWMFGRQNGLLLSTATAASGTVNADFNGYTLALTGEEPNRAPRLESFTTTPFDNFADITVGAQSEG